MNTVRHDSYTRGALRRSTEAVSGLHFLLMFVAAGLLVLTRVEHPIVVSLQDYSRQVARPVLGQLSTVAAPFRNFANNIARYFTVESEFRRLERELASLRQLLNRTSDLAKRNEELGRLAQLVKAAPVNAVTVDVIAGPTGLFGKSVTIGAGQSEGLRYGQPVFSSEGLFGRIVSVGEMTAQVLVLNDINSRIPVEVGDARRPALVVGDNSERPRLVYLNASDTVKTGAVVVTSGASGEFPRGITVGQVAVESGDMRVKTTAKLLAEAYLTVLRYELPSAAGHTDKARADKARAASGRGKLDVGLSREAKR